MLYFTYIFNFSLMIALPVLLGIAVTRRWKTGWALWGWGALAFIASQAARWPLLIGLTALFNAGVLPHIPEGYTNAFNIAVLSLTAGLFEEGSRYLFYRFAIPRARRWEQAVTFGAGHGGIEAILLGVGVALSFINMAALRVMDWNTLALTAEQRAGLTEQFTAYWAAPVWLTVLGAVERVFALCLHVTLAVLVLQALNRRNGWWWLAAVGWHALANAVAVTVAQTAGPLASEGTLAIIAALSLWALLALRRAPAVELPPEAVVNLPATAAAPVVDPESELRRKMDESRFNG